MVVCFNAEMLPPTAARSSASCGCFPFLFSCPRLFFAFLPPSATRRRYIANDGRQRAEIPEKAGIWEGNLDKNRDVCYNDSNWVSVRSRAKSVKNAVLKPRKRSRPIYKYFFKRLIDILLSLIGMIVLALPMLIIAIVIKIDSPGPVFFKQKRVGIHKSYFQIVKFRSMPVTVPHDTPTHQFNAADSLSSFQLAMRKFSIDEIPQLWCIFIGKMSIVGPRPALWNQDDLIAERDKYGANDVKPGLTGWAQINGRDELEIDVKAKLDGEYVEKLSFAFDCRCFFKTIFSVLKHDGVAEGGPEAHEKEEPQVIEK